MSSLTPRFDRLDKNYLINGDFEIWQRGTSFSATGYSSDRWRAVISGTASISQNLSGVPDGSPATARYSSSGGASFSLSQALESIWTRSLKGKTVTATVKIKRNSTYDANFIFSIDKNSTGDTAAGGSWSSIVSTTLLNAAIPTASYLTVTVTAVVPNDATANGLRVMMQHSGSAANGSILDMSQVTLVVGDKTPTEFSRAARDYAEELLLCKRYYWRETPTYIYMDGYSLSAGGYLVVGSWRHPVPMRVSPSMTMCTFATVTNVNAPVLGASTADGYSMQAVSTVNNGRMIVQNANSPLSADAEL